MQIAKISLDDYANYLKPRARDWHKGLSGHVLIIGGGPGMSGAPRMAGIAALRVGAGLVTIATHPAHAVMLNAAYPELIVHSIEDSTQLEPFIAAAKVIAIGPGLTQTPWAHMLFEYVFSKSLSIPIIIDADALNILAQQSAPSFSDTQSKNWILTPHPAEAARLLNMTVSAVQSDRCAAVINLQKQYSSIAILKGAGTLVCLPEGLPVICDKGNPGMATAGMGDVLTGVIAGLCAQGMPIDVAAKLGVYLHASAGDEAAKFGERGMIACDLLPYLRQLSNLNLFKPNS